MDNNLKFAQLSLTTPLLNLNNDIVNDFVKALFLDESIVYAKILRGNKIIAEKNRPRFQLQELDSAQQTTLFMGPKFIVKSSDIRFRDRDLGSRRSGAAGESSRKQGLWQIYV